MVLLRINALHGFYAWVYFAFTTAIVDCAGHMLVLIAYQTTERKLFTM